MFHQKEHMSVVKPCNLVAAAIMIAALRLHVSALVAEGAQTSLFFAWNDNRSVMGVRNCTCGELDLHCAFVPGFCTCVNITLDEVATVAERARSNGTVSWWNDREVVICCEGAQTTNVLEQVLAQLVDFSFCEELKFYECHNLTPSDEQAAYAVYGLRELSARTVTNVEHPKKAFDLEDPDGDLTDDSRLYRDHHVAVVSRNIVDGERDLKAISFIHEQSDEALPSLVQAAIERSPSSIRSKSDGTFMWTPIYSDPIR